MVIRFLQKCLQGKEKNKKKTQGIVSKYKKIPDLFVNR